MKLRDVPDPVWYGLLAIVAAGGVYWLTKRAAAAVGDAVTGTVQAAGTAAYNAGNAVQDAIIPGDATLGTWLFDRVQDARQLLGLPSEHDLSSPTPAKPAGSWSANGYDYGTAGVSGIPWRPEAKPLPDIFNFSLDYIR
ncbi:hypothetical protein C3942_21660 [Solimonas fluminis]|uniref:Uncharacterized protein n=1 Tax=Solimonas fluminis TaxID=2086571 RepID=A0A2S5T9X9_9GAMM|nr:hypothetical protein [Solimonas fluminis]PPE71805.1 hypothetical protein C3942_21660 [Solimonas fluminis]